MRPVATGLPVTGALMRNHCSAEHGSAEQRAGQRPVGSLDLVPRSPELPFDRVSADLRAKIESGELAVGDQMPTLRKISEDYRVSQTTAKKVIEALARDGLVEIKPRWGTFVR